MIVIPNALAGERERDLTSARSFYCCWRGAETRQIRPHHRRRP